MSAETNFGIFSYGQELAQITIVSGGTTFIAFAAPGTQTDEAKWQVKKVVVSGDTTTVTWADGNAKFDNLATNLSSLTYA